MSVKPKDICRCGSAECRADLERALLRVTFDIAMRAPGPLDDEEAEALTEAAKVLGVRRGPEVTYWRDRAEEMKREAETLWNPTSTQEAPEPGA